MRLPAFGPTTLLAATLLLALAGCASGPSPGAATAPRASSAQAAALGPAAVDEDALADALTSMVEGRQRWQHLEIAAECQGDSGWRQARLFGNGVGIWNRERQFTLQRGDLISLLDALRRFGFARMPETYGGKGDLAPPVDEALATEVVCFVALELDGMRKQVTQLAKGRQSAELRALADQILTLAADRGRHGVGADDLAAGLAKVADGRLAPETLSLFLHRKPAPRSGEAEGFRMRVEGLTVTTRAYSPTAGYGEPRTLELAPGELAALVLTLRDAGLDDLPANLWAEHYTDLAVELLSHERRIQARQFAGMDASTHGAAQERFDRIVAAAAELARRSLEAGS